MRRFQFTLKVPSKQFFVMVIVIFMISVAVFFISLSIYWILKGVWDWDWLS